MAISIDGLITRGEDYSGWVSKNDWEEFYSYIKQNDAVLMGRKTMEQFGEDEFPIPGTLNIVLSRNADIHKDTELLLITQGTPKEILDLAQKHGVEKLLIIGGENVNSQFLRENLIDEIILSVHPLVIGEGKSLFGRDPLDVKLSLVSSRVINNELIQLRYKVIK